MVCSGRVGYKHSGLAFLDGLSPLIDSSGDQERKKDADKKILLFRGLIGGATKHR